eukprot:gene17746-biopygen5143
MARVPPWCGSWHFQVATWEKYIPSCNASNHRECRGTLEKPRDAQGGSRGGALSQKPRSGVLSQNPRGGALPQTGIEQWCSGIAAAGRLRGDGVRLRAAGWGLPSIAGG